MLIIQTIPIDSGSGLSQNSLALAELVETVDKRYLLEKKGAIVDAEVMMQITYALQIQIGAIGEYN